MEPEIKDIEPKDTAVITFAAKPDELSEQFAIVLPEVWSVVASSKTDPAGPPFARYLEHDGEKFVIEAGIPVTPPIDPEGRVERGELPGGRAVVGWYQGPYHGLGAAHDEMMEWLKANHLESGPPWEIYWTDPGIEPDQQKWQTELIYPLMGLEA